MPNVQDKLQSNYLREVYSQQYNELHCIVYTACRQGDGIPVLSLLPFIMSNFLPLPSSPPLSPLPHLVLLPLQAVLLPDPPGHLLLSDAAQSSDHITPVSLREQLQPLPVHEPLPLVVILLSVLDALQHLRLGRQRDITTGGSPTAGRLVPRPLLKRAWDEAATAGCMNNVTCDHP